MQATTFPVSWQFFYCLSARLNINHGKISITNYVIIYVAVRLGILELVHA